jgi:sporulation protein YlmC with PRC-barrel domain
LETDSKVAKVLGVIIDPENGKLVAFKVTPSILSYRIISPRDVVGVQPNFIAIAKESAIVKPEEILHVKKIIDDEILILGNWIKIKDGEWLGKVEDLVIDSETLSVVKLYVKGLAIGIQTKPFFGTFKENRILDYKNVLSIKKDFIIVKSEPEVKEKVEEKVSEPELA